MAEEGRLGVRAREWLRPFVPRAVRDAYRRHRRARGPVRTGERELGAIFFHIPKAAGLSVALALFGERVGHRRAVEVRRREPELFDELFTFTFVRNPWDRMVSAFAFLKGGGLVDGDAEWADRYLGGFDRFDAFVRSLEEPRWRREVLRWKHFRPQCDYVCSEEGRVLVDFVGRCEQLAQDFEIVRQRLRSDVVLGHLNQSVREDWRSYYTPETARCVAEIYESDLRTFGYEVEGWMAG